MGAAFRRYPRHTQALIDRLQTEARAAFPENVTAFREDMAVHGRYVKPCPRCGEKILRIRYAGNETNYCARCQTAGRVLADRGLSRLFGIRLATDVGRIGSAAGPPRMKFFAYLSSLRLCSAPDIQVLRTPNNGIQPRAIMDRAGTLHLLYYVGDHLQGDSST